MEAFLGVKQTREKIDKKKLKYQRNHSPLKFNRPLPVKVVY